MGSFIMTLLMKTDCLLQEKTIIYGLIMWKSCLITWTIPLIKSIFVAHLLITILTTMMVLRNSKWKNWVELDTKIEPLAPLILDHVVSFYFRN